MLDGVVDGCEAVIADGDVDDELVGEVRDVDCDVAGVLECCAPAADAELVCDSVAVRGREEGPLAAAADSLCVR